MPSLSDNVSKETAFFLIAIALGVAIAVLVGFGTDWRVLSFSGIGGGEMVGKLAALVVVAFFIERAVEVFMTLWRGPDSIKLHDELKQIEKEMQGSTKQASLPELFTGFREKWVKKLGIK